MPVDAFIERWQFPGASEQGNATLFLSELCNPFGIARPDIWANVSYTLRIAFCWEKSAHAGTHHSSKTQLHLIWLF
ncbi:hypothetical protein [Salinibacter ruber]|uniref:hypothetical protein n=1 Tax=Salinibacter ruber TaxID=146919 RepID=UPI00216A626F|nr:hypothetical protein [Salinibacter ruber]MCS3698273.1 hypothetical protein [Salinibacter ruber]